MSSALRRHAEQEADRRAAEVAPYVFDGIPLGHFGAILADPPWRFQAWSPKGDERAPPYPTMTLAAIKSLPVRALAAKDAVLFLWVTDPLLPAGLEVIKAWGFTFKTVAFTWAKLNQNGGGKPCADENAFFMGQGYWTRGNPEMCLLATRGKPRRISAKVRQFIAATRREHSRKPDEIYSRVEALAAGPYLELFSRTSAPGWTPWGADAGLFDVAAE